MPPPPRLAWPPPDPGTHRGMRPIGPSSVTKGAPPPPFHTPVFVLPHHPRRSLEMEGGTTFHFLDAPPAEALEAAREAAGGQDVRIGGGPTTIREFLAAGLVDHMHVAVVPILLGRGKRLCDGLEGLEPDHQIETTSVPHRDVYLVLTP